MDRASQWDVASSPGVHRPGGPPMQYQDWMRAAAEEYRRILELLRQLDVAAWAAPTDCDGWDVRAMVSHLAGAAQGAASVRELVRQQRKAAPLLPGADTIDRINEWQVLERADRSPEQLIDELTAAGPRAVRARSRIPRPIRALPVPFGPPLGTKPFGYLVGRILTRDAWLHRVDLSRATGRTLRLTEDHDARIVADVVSEWAALHGRPFRLTLTGPAGGSWDRGSGDPVGLDAVEFCRILSGRAGGQGLLGTRVNF